MSLAAIILATVAYSQSVRDQHSRLLKPYLTPRTVTNLEWDLLQFNMLWQGSYSDDVSYLTSFPVIFDPKARRFRATFAVQEKRTYDDPSPFLSLPRAQRESIFQGAIDQLVELLGQSFPEVKNHRGLVYVEFWFRAKSGGRSVVAKYENGNLILAE
jgi:hypothetical protein